MYTGREWDKETGLYYYRARYYDPMEGRFISKDPIGFDGGDVNLYGYVRNNPTNLTDPSGLSPDWFSCWASCIEKNRLDPLAALVALGSAVPKKALPPFRVVNQRQRLTTPLSSAAHYIDNKAIASGMRQTGRWLSRVATPLTIVEGIYDIGVIGYCASKCEADSCSN